MSQRKRQPLLVSACLLGENCRFDGTNNSLAVLVSRTLHWYYDLIPVCPEQLGGLPTPRPSAEIRAGDGRDVHAGTAKVFDKNGQDVTAAFVRGAVATLRLANESCAIIALLKARSPSCGNDQIYDGSFSGTLRDGVGVTTALLQKNGVAIFNEEQLIEIYNYKISGRDKENYHASADS